MSLFGWHVRNRMEQQKKPEVKIGQVWTITSDNPFAENGRVVITAIKKGYVQYKMKHGTISSMDIETFTRIYKLEN